MLIIEVQKNNTQIIGELKQEFLDCEIVDLDSFNADSIIQIIIPLAAILAPVISPIIMKVLTDSTITVKYDGIELSGDYKKVKAMLKEIEIKRADKNGDC